MQETWVGRSPGEGNSGFPLQDSGLENSMDCIVHGVAELDPTGWLSLFLKVEITMTGASSAADWLYAFTKPQWTLFPEECRAWQRPRSDSLRVSQRRLGRRERGALLFKVRLTVWPVLVHRAARREQRNTNGVRHKRGEKKVFLLAGPEEYWQGSVCGRRCWCSSFEAAFLWPLYLAWRYCGLF